MCPISGLVQFLFVIVTLLLVCHAVMVRTQEIQFKPVNASIHMYDTITVNYTIQGDPDYDTLKLYTEDAHVAVIENAILISNPKFPVFGSFNLTGNFLGKTEVRLKDVKTDNRAMGRMNVTVIRQERAIDTAFTASVATLVSIIYINFGCALHWGEVVKTLKRPIGPTIGFCGQFIVMPLLSYGLSALLFPGNHVMQLGFFFTGISPSGGASNIWTAVLDANLDLSVTMTTICTFAAFLMMPFWLFTLGKVIFDQAEMGVPYLHISMFAFGLAIPLAIGYFISRYWKKVGQFLVKILKVFSSLLIIFIIVFAIVTNLYLFELFSWQIVVAGMGLPYLGYGIAYLIATLLRQPPQDVLAIAIETGIQNTGIAIFLLRFILPQPEADLTTIAPVSVAMMTPFPLLFLFLYKKIRARLSTHKKLNDNKESPESLEIDTNSSSHKK